MTKEEMILKLNRYKGRLDSDTGSITTLTRRAEDTKLLYQRMLRNQRTPTVVAGIDRMKEPSQWNDSCLTSSCDYIKREVNALEEEIRAEEEARRQAAAAAAAARRGSK